MRAPTDTDWMRLALGLARRGLGNVAPNPAVGCLLIQDSKVVGRGWTQLGGRPHAEPMALQMAGTLAKGATAYVTLEPCSHHGQTPPCADALIAAGVQRVVIAVQDTDPRVNGAGLAKLTQAGIDVTYGVLETEARALNRGFFLKAEENRPLFSLKIAASLDGKIATASGESKWITGDAARRFGHMLRAQHDGILVGINTVLKDTPDLNCRLPGLEHASPTRIILDSSLRFPVTSPMLATINKAPVWIFYNQKEAKIETREALEKAGVRLFPLKDVRDMAAVAATLAMEGVTRVLVEGGGQIHASFLNAEFVDCLYLITAGKALGADSLDAVGNIPLARLADAPHLKLMSCRKLGKDMLATYEKTE